MYEVEENICFVILCLLTIAIAGLTIESRSVEENESVELIYCINDDVTVEEITLSKEPTRYDVPLDEDIQEYIISESMEYHINPALVLAIIDRESSFDVMAAGDGGQSIGLMQINTYWQQDRMAKLGVTDLYDPYENVKIGIDILSELFGKSSDLSYVLMSYNGGESYAKSNINKGIYETEYTRYVLRRMEELDCDVAR